MFKDFVSQKIKIITHSGGFHADDVFAVASILVATGKEIDEVEIIRTRDKDVIEEGDYVVDVGLVYDADINRFDHHQAEGAGRRDNGIQYASFGVVWKKFGEKISGSKRVAEILDKRLVMPIDAYDTGTELMKPLIEGVWPYTIQSVVQSYDPKWGSSDEDRLDAFKDAVLVSKRIIENEVSKIVEEERARPKIVEAYENSSNKEVIILENAYGWSRVFISQVLYDFSEPVYFVRQHYDKNWQVVCVQGPGYVTRKDFPESWRGKNEKELAEVTGVDDAVFCHKEGFMCVTVSKESAIRLAELALSS